MVAGLCTLDGGGILKSRGWKWKRDSHMFRIADPFDRNVEERSETLDLEFSERLMLLDEANEKVHSIHPEHLEKCGGIRDKRTSNTSEISCEIFEPL